MIRDTAETLKRITSIATWKRGSRRAIHKPLLLLSKLAQIQRGEPRLSPYSEVHEILGTLLEEFGPPRTAHHPEYPFWRLQNDGEFWEVPERGEILGMGAVTSSGDVAPSTLVDVGARGGFSEEIDAVLREDPDLVNAIAAKILEEHFPPSVHESLLDALGMPWAATVGKGRNRDPAFVHEVVRLYEHRCAMCGFDGRLGMSHLALEAAHIQWHAYGGPDDPTNGLLLCSIHHQALDRGAVGISEDRRIRVSQHLHGGERVSALVIDLSGRELRTPVDPSTAPALPFIEWHEREVFRDPARPTPDRSA